MDRCPNCRARVGNTGPCRRCGMDLELLCKVEEATAARLQRALRHLVDGDCDAASAALRQLLSLQRDPLAEQLLAFADTLRAPPMHGSEDVQRDLIDETKRALPNAFHLSEQEMTDVAAFISTME